MSMELWPQDWSAVLVPEGPIAELIVRATAIYFLLFALMRIGGRRLFAKLAMSDILLVLILAVAVREGITGGFQTVGDAAVLATTLLVWNKTVDWLAYRFPVLRGPLRHHALPIIQDGRLNVDNARATLLTRTEIMERLRENGLTAVDQVKEARLEQDGSFSVVPK
jgi:uncharacterized membrane protein YcaP (DUF421 family)